MKPHQKIITQTVIAFIFIACIVYAITCGDFPGALALAVIGLYLFGLVANIKPPSADKPLYDPTDSIYH